MDVAGKTPPPSLHPSSSNSPNRFWPRRLLARLLRLFRFKKHKLKNEITHSTNGTNKPGQLLRNNTSFKLGVGCGFLYLMAASKNELGKIVELRKEMEILIQNAKGELQNKDSLLKPLKPSDAFDSPLTDIPEVSCSNSQPKSKRNTVPNGSLEHKKIEKDESADEINELQAEFELELERLHMYLEGEEAAFGDADNEIVELNSQGNVEDSCLASHSSSFFGEIIMDRQGASDGLSFGVPPFELERRLHELLEARLQERITELEYALECTKQKLIEKEMEVTWLKDSAPLISQNIPETTRFTFQLDPETALMFGEVEE
ncbi:PREDICTED: protein POLAR LOCALIZATION DURING ASYMMETRIC DIVISION AND REDISTRIBUTION-like isoform X2 [Lupinus angustifolius]|uniref:protein POLAR LOCALIZATION DURING ASYMMETRIC DIVISION AND REDISTRIBUTION-like isoform X2 n=1 Tax=Lupinus angustifolius TaxID=3871 RepID=UPI00092E69A3|nr:PREDICTED: protein POLAR LOCALIZATION DURING ASYMMETRIC DIVISION AND REDISTRIBUTION-like isoform X2 [Lupinus angustifolius]